MNRMDIPGTPHRQNSADSGLGSLTETLEKTGRTFNKNVVASNPDQRIFDSTPCSQAYKNSYLTMGERDVSGLYFTTEMGKGWPPETLELLDKGHKIVRAYNTFTSLLSEKVTAARPDHSLHPISVIFGIAPLESDKERLSQSRITLQEQMKVIGCLDDWKLAETAAREVLQQVAVKAVTHPHSRTKLDESNKNLRDLGSDVMHIIQKVRSPVKKHTASLGERILILKWRLASRENKKLQKAYDRALQEKMKLLEPALEKLTEHMNLISTKHQAEFAPCREAARPDVRLVNQKGEPKELETEKTSSMLFMITDSMSSLLKDFAKAYFIFQDSGGREKAEKPRSVEEIERLAK